jgi:hypothetical protein
LLLHPHHNLHHHDVERVVHIWTMKLWK